MNLAPGTRLGPHEILAPLGAGGMGEVYRARDTRLGREVAIKVLPKHLSASPEVRARFEREAKTVSGLNHPHICTLFDVGREGDTDYLVMELIEGETLASRLAKGPLPAAEVLRVGTEIADALDRAHRAGIVHRDLKPGNVMITRGGAKLMDFGLARATGLADSQGSGASIATLTQSPTVAQPLTAEGSIVGTFQYMSPEQLEGKEADERSDLWALGCVLYEMATGKRAFDGKSQASLITSIMGSEPAPISQVTPVAPPALDRVVGACLAKDPADRLQSAHDVKLQLSWIAEGGSLAGLSRAAAKGRRVREWLGWAVAVVLLLLGVARQATMKPSGHDLVTRTTIGAPPGARLEITGDDAGPPALSPDGTMLVFSAVGGGAGKRLWLRRLDELAARPLPGTDDASYPFWSPDSRSIGFFNPAKLKRLDLEQGSVITLSDSVDAARGGAWSRDGVIVFAPKFGTGLFEVPAAGGPRRPVTVLDSVSETTHRFPQFMPDGRHFIYLSANHRDPEGNTSGIYYASLDGGERRRLITSKSNAVYAQGFLLFVRDSTLMAQEFDAASGTTKGDPRATREVVQLDRSTWNATITATDSGTLVYGLGGRAGNNRIALFDRSGVRLSNLTSFGNILNIDLAPDDRRVLYEWQQVPLADLWILDVTTGTKSRITTNPDDETSPIWLPDGKRVAFAGRRAGRYRIFFKRADGSGEETQFLEDPSDDLWPVATSWDGTWLAFGKGVASGTAHGALCITPLAEAGTPRVLVPASDGFQGAQFSPDGKWLAFAATVSGRSEVYVSPLPAGGEGLSARWQISGNGGDRPRWRRDGRELYYVRLDGTIMAVSVNGTGTDFRVEAEKPLFQVFQRIILQTFDVTGDGGRFLINTLGGDEGEPLAVVTHWLETLPPQ
jgi:Tol biopolymer transport system component